jgi:hypothetical protein
MIIVGMLTLIASARFDRTTMYIICGVTILLLLMCILQFVHSIHGVNQYCQLGKVQKMGGVSEQLQWLHTCGSLVPTMNIILLVFALFNGCVKNLH